MTVSPLQSLCEFKIRPVFYYLLNVKVFQLFDVSPKNAEDTSDIFSLRKCTVKHYCITELQSIKTVGT